MDLNNVFGDEQNGPRRERRAHRNTPAGVTYPPLPDETRRKRERAEFAALEAVARHLAALACPRRLAVLRELWEGPRFLGDLAEPLRVGALDLAEGGYLFYDGRAGLCTLTPAGRAAWIGARALLT